MEPIVRELTGLSEADVATLAAAAINNINDLSQFDEAELGELLPTMLPGIRKKLANVACYVADRQPLTADTTMQGITHFLKALSRQPSTSTTGGPRASDLSREGVKVGVNPIDKFSGRPSEWQTFEYETVATINQSMYASLLMTEPEPTNEVMQQCNKAFYSMLMRATLKGGAMHVVKKTKDQNGYAAWQALKTWYGSAETSRALIDHHQKILSDLRCNKNMEAFDYINNWIMSTMQLEELGEGMTEGTKKTRFLDGIDDDDYKHLKLSLLAEPSKTFDDCVNAIRMREQDLMRSGERESDNLLSSSSKARRGAADGGGPSSSKGNNDGGGKSQIPFIPGFILAKPTRQNLLLWRKIWNEEGRTIRPDEASEQEGSGGASGGNSSGSNKDHNATPKSARKSGKHRTNTTKKSRRAAADAVTAGLSVAGPKACQTKTIQRGLQD